MLYPKSRWYLYTSPAQFWGTCMLTTELTGTGILADGLHYQQWRTQWSLGACMITYALLVGLPCYKKRLHANVTLINWLYMSVPYMLWPMNTDVTSIGLLVNGQHLCQLHVHYTHIFAVSNESCCMWLRISWLQMCLHGWIFILKQFLIYNTCSKW